MLMQHAEPTAGNVPVTQADVRGYAWIVFALTVGLLLSDYMSRQVLNAVFRCSRPHGAFPIPGWVR